MTTGTLTGTGVLIRLMMRRERWMTLVTVAVFVLLNAATGASITSMYPTAAQRVEARAGLGNNAAFRFLLGPLSNTDSAAAMTVWRAGLFLVVALSVCAVLLVVRQTRKEEELGRTELVRAAVTGPLAPIGAATVVAVAFSVVVGLGMSLMLFPLGADVADVAAVFVQYSATALAAVGVALVTAQVAKTSHIANLGAASVVLVGYLLRGVADATQGWGWLRAITPMGWAQLIDPLGDNNFWYGLADLGVFVAGFGLAAVLVTRRDLGAGLIAPRPGPAAATRMPTIEAVIARLTLPLLGSWVAGVVVYGLIVGFMQPTIDDLTKGNDQLDKVLRQSGVHADLSTLFGVTIMGFFAVAAAAWAVNVATRMRSEEHDDRAEILLATPVSRRRYYAAYVLVAVLGAVAILVLAGVGMLLGNGFAGGGWSAAADTMSSAAAQLPATLAMSSIALLLYGFRPSLVPVGWLLVIAALFLGPMSGMFNLPGWVRDLSPFTHTPAVPVAPMTWTPVLILFAVAVVFTVGGLFGFGKRDIH